MTIHGIGRQVLQDETYILCAHLFEKVGAALMPLWIVGVVFQFALHIEQHGTETVTRKLGQEAECQMTLPGFRSAEKHQGTALL